MLSTSRVRTAPPPALLGLVNHALYLGLSSAGMNHVPSGLTSVVTRAPAARAAAG